MLNFEGDVAVVTGGASGIGAATAQTFAKLGANVVIADVNEEKSLELIKTSAHLSGSITYCKTDILIEEEIDNLIDFTIQNFGKITVLHNNAGVPRSLAPDCEIIDLPLDWWHKTIDAHLTSAMLGSKHALPHMIKAGGGAIINTSSAAFAHATVDLPSYSAAKAGLHQLTREIAATYGRDNVRCNAIIPGLVLTERGRTTVPPEQIKMFATETPLPYLAEAQDIANVAVFLASDASRMINGEAIRLDGGMMTKLPYWLPKMKQSRGPAFSRAAYREPTTKKTSE